MRGIVLSAVLAGVFWWPAGLSAADLAKVDRAIKQEPAYRCGAKYLPSCAE
jgi:hypothetical protein